MTIPLGNTPSGAANTPDELKTESLTWMGKATERGEAPVIVFYRTLEHRNPFAPNSKNIDPNTGAPKLVYPVTVDMYFPNGPLAGRVYRRVGFINAGLTGAIRETAIGSINVGQLGVGDGQNGKYPQLNALDPDAYEWAMQIHVAAGGNVFLTYDPAGERTAASTVAQVPSTQQPANRFAGTPVPQPGQQQPTQQPTQPQGPPAALQQPAQQSASNGQPQPTTTPPPPGVPGLGGPPPGMPGAGGMPAALAGSSQAPANEPPF